MPQGEVRIAWEPLKDFVKEVFVQVGMPPPDAETYASVLIWANLRGVDSHGVWLIPWHLEAADIGHMKVKPNIQIEKETPATLLINADHAFGPVVSVFAMNRVMKKAKEVGIGWALIRNTNHQGAMGYYSVMAADKGMAGINWVCGPSNMAPHGAKFAGITNNPISISVPAKRHHPLVLDMATSVVSAVKIFFALEKGVSIPEGWALDKDGNPTTDASKANILMPFGGPKGSGLTIMLECLASIMVDNPKLEPILQGKEKPFGVEGLVGHPDRIRQHIQNSVVAAIDISAFTDLEAYKEHIDNLINGLKALPRAEGLNEILVPGEPEWKTFDERSRNGIPIPQKTLSNLQSVATRFNIKLPTSQ